MRIPLLTLNSIFWPVFGIWLCLTHGVPKVLDPEKYVHSTLEKNNQLAELAELEAKLEELEAREAKEREEAERSKAAADRATHPLSFVNQDILKVIEESRPRNLVLSVYEQSEEWKALHGEIFELEWAARQDARLSGLGYAVLGFLLIGMLYPFNKLINKALCHAKPSHTLRQIKSHSGISNSVISQIIGSNEEPLVAGKLKRETEYFVLVIPLWFNVVTKYVVVTETRLLLGTKTLWGGVTQVVPISYESMHSVVFSGKARMLTAGKISIRLITGDIIELTTQNRDLFEAMAETLGHYIEVSIEK